MGPSSLSCLGLLLSVGHRIGQLMNVNVHAAEQPHDAVPADAAMAVLKLREVRDTDVGARTHLLLGQPLLDAQLAEGTPERLVIADRCVGWRVADHCNLSKVQVGFAGPYKRRPRCSNTRAPGAEDQGLQRVGHDTVGPSWLSSPRHSLRRLPAKEEPMTTDAVAKDGDA